MISKVAQWVSSTLFKSQDIIDDFAYVQDVVTDIETKVSTNYYMGAQGIQGVQGEKGDTGDSAYNAAVANGFVGTELEWIASLKGEQGIQGEQGITGESGTIELAGVIDGGTPSSTYTSSTFGDGGLVPVGGSSGQVLAKRTATDYDVEWVAQSGGGGSGYVNLIDTPPVTPSSLDDEFDDENLNTKWSWVNQGTSTLKVENSKVVLDIAPGTDMSRGIVQAAPSGDFTAIAKINANVREINYSGWGIAPYNSANSRYLWFGKGARSGFRSIGVSRCSLTTWASDLYLSHGIGGSDIYVKLVKVGTTLSFYYSLDGTCWLLVATEAIATHLVDITHIGLIFYRNNSTTTEKMFGLCDWFRVS